ncbi:low temperature requirement protein A [Luteimonas sp. SX5]|uniref:Low temperature requirement protein A n=1 Tax=Luteimonas galliterrae TaxID=2940486 RepID=A0ABT0ME11_9GAMM|nr:low temperature requirement protein A [Luteimonas galliterrae]MCL1633107.1 low temperature requirement protein A [Luteimonas galliterrae]
MNASPKPLLRTRGGHESGRVGMVELFFDLVFVFAVTQLSHTLLAQPTPAGALQTALLFVAMWWVWIYTSWITNWLDPERVPVRLMLFALMLAGLLMSSSIPKAFGAHGLAFAGAYAFMHVGRTLFMLWATRNGPAALRRNFQRVLVWLLASGALWIAGGFGQGETRFGLWLLALAIEFVSPLVLFWVPGLGRSTTADWNVDGHHMAERCALFIIIALGESLLITGATFADLAWNADTVAAFAVAFLGSVAMWWIYFDTGAERGHRRIANSADPGRVARSAYTYLHLPIVAGIVVCAVADEIVLVHPGHAEDAGIATILAGPALYLLGNALFKWVTNDRRGPPLSHLIGLLLLFALAPFAFAHLFSALALGATTTAILMLVAAWETVALHRPARAS